MKPRKHNLELKKRRKSLVARIHDYMKNYAANCKYSFNRMLST